MADYTVWEFATDILIAIGVVGVFLAVWFAAAYVVVCGFLRGSHWMRP